MKHALILAGGKGTRLGSLTQDLPKPMVPLAGKPIVQYQVELCARYGIEKITFIVNHLGEAIQNYFGDGSQFGVDIQYFEEKEPLGTVGGVKELEAELTEDFLVLYGDVLMEMDLQKLFDFHQEKGSEATLVVHPNDHPYDSDLVEMDENERVVKILPKPHPENFRYHNMVNAAVYVFSPKIFNYLEKGKKADFGKDIFPNIYDKIEMFGYNTPEYLKDMGTPDRMKQVEKDIRFGKVKRRSLRNKQKAIFLDRDGVLNFDNNLIHKTEDFELYNFTANAIRKINSTDYLAIVATNQSVVARNLTTMEGLAEIHKKMETELGNEGAKLDEIKFCPHHPDKGFPEENPDYKIDCECRKPKAGMLLEAAENFNIDLAQSFMVGDSERDILAGKAAGCQTIGVMTGAGLKNTKTLPDYFFENVKHAVDFLFDQVLEKHISDIIDLAKETSKRPFVIGIGGNTRSGKSNFAQRLKSGLETNGVSVLKIRLDDWILPKEKRENEIDVFHNFQMNKMEEDLKNIFAGKQVQFDGYSHHLFWENNDVSYEWKNEQVILIDGVPAIATEKMRSLLDYKIFKKIKEKELKKRMFEFYKWKGKSENEIDRIWAMRKPNEYDIISENEIFADCVI